MREGASDAFRREINAASSEVIPFVELLRTEREKIVDTNTEWLEADSIFGFGRRDGAIRLTGTENVILTHATGTALTLTALVNPVNAATLSVASVQWGSDVTGQEIHAFTARLNPNTGGGQLVSQWVGQLFAVHSVEANWLGGPSTRWNLMPMAAPIAVTAGSVEADVLFELPNPAPVSPAPVLVPDIEGEFPAGGDVPTGPTTLLAIWAIRADGTPADRVAWVADDATGQKTIGGHTVSRYNLTTPQEGAFGGTSYRNTGTSNGVPRFSLVGRSYDPVTVSFTDNPLDLGAAPDSASTLELVADGRARAGSISYEIYNGTTWLTYIDGDQVGVNRTAQGGSDLSSVARTQTYQMRVTLTPATVGASPVVSRIGVREIGASEIVTDVVNFGGVTWAVDPLTGKSEVPEIDVTFIVDGRRDYRSLIEDTLATYHVGALQLRIWMGDPQAYKSEWLHLDDFLVDDYQTQPGAITVTCVSPLSLIKREVPEATGATITPLTYLAQTPAAVYDDLIANQVGVPSRFVGQGIVATTPLMSREVVEIAQGRDLIEQVARIANSAVISSQGKLKAVRFYGLDSPEGGDLTLFTLEETNVVAFSPGYRTRVTSAVVKYDWRNERNAFDGSRRAENVAAINNLGRGAIDLEEQIDEDLCRWIGLATDAQAFASGMVEMFGPGMKLVRLQSSVRRPWLEPGDPIAVESDLFVGRDPVSGVGVRGPMIAYATVQAVNDVEGRDITAWVRSWEDIVPSAVVQAVSGFGLDLRITADVLATPGVLSGENGIYYEIVVRDVGEDVTHVRVRTSYDFTNTTGPGSGPFVGSGTIAVTAPGVYPVPFNAGTGFFKIDDGTNEQHYKVGQITVRAQIGTLNTDPHGDSHTLEGKYESGSGAFVEPDTGRVDRRGIYRGFSPRAYGEVVGTPSLAIFQETADSAAYEGGRMVFDAGDHVVQAGTLEVDRKVDIHGSGSFDTVLRAEKASLFSGTASSATATTLVRSGSGWTVNAYAGQRVEIFTGTGAQQVRRVVSNTSTTLTVEPAWRVIPDATSTYRIYAPTYLHVKGSANWRHEIRDITLDGIEVVYGATSTDYGNGVRMVACEIKNAYKGVEYRYNTWVGRLIDCEIHHCAYGVYFDFDTPTENAGAAMRIRGCDIFDCHTCVYVDSIVSDGYHLILEGTDLENSEIGLKAVDGGDGVIDMLGCHFELLRQYGLDVEGATVHIVGGWAFTAATTHTAWLRLGHGNRTFVSDIRLQWDDAKLVELVGGSLVLDSDSIFANGAFFGQESSTMATASSFGGGVYNGGMAFTGTAALTSGTATSGASTTLTDTGKAWTTNEFANKRVRITGGTGKGQTRRIASNTATALTVSPAWTTTVDSTSTYRVDTPGEERGGKVFAARRDLTSSELSAATAYTLATIRGYDRSARVLEFDVDVTSVDTDVVLRVQLNPGGAITLDLDPTTVAVGGGRFRVVHTPNGAISFSGSYNGEYMEASGVDTFDESALRTIDVALEATGGTKPTGRVRHLFEYVH